MRATDEWLRRLDDWRRKQPIIPSRAEAIRQLVEMGLLSTTEPLGARAQPAAMAPPASKLARSVPGQVRTSPQARPARMPVPPPKTRW
jgi:hypothetical protein